MTDDDDEFMTVPDPGDPEYFVEVPKSTSAPFYMASAEIDRLAEEISTFERIIKHLIRGNISPVIEGYTWRDTDTLVTAKEVELIKRSLAKPWP